MIKIYFSQVGLTIHQPKKSKLKVNSYFESLDPPSRKRYIKKIGVIGGINPYAIKSETFDRNIENFSTVTYPDIVNYLISGSSPLAANQLKAYKSLEAYD